MRGEAGRGSGRISGRIEIEDLWVDLKEFHLREIDLEIGAGEYFCVLGPTGAGKTVLLETIAGLFRPSRGRVLIDGEEVTDIPPERRGIGFVYQDYALFPHLSVAENVAFGLELLDRRHLLRLSALAGDRDFVAGRGKKEIIRERVESISRMLSIDHLLHRSPDTLSGGEQQRAALARALAVEPRLLHLDEPLSALDPETREGLQRELARVHGELGTTTLHVTHDFEEAVALGDRIAVVHEGRIVQVGSSEDIFRRPANEFVARFVGVRNIFAGAIIDTDQNGYKTFTCDSLDLAVISERRGAGHASIRPEDIVVSLDPLRSSARNAFAGRIIEIADRGTLIYVTVRVGSAQAGSSDFVCIITHRSLDEMALRPDKQVHIAFKASAVHVF